MVLFNENTPNDVLWVYFNTYGYHAAGVEICDRAVIDENQDARPYAEKIWEMAKAKRRLDYEI